MNISSIKSFERYIPSFSEHSTKVSVIALLALTIFALLALTKIHNLTRPLYSGITLTYNYLIEKLGEIFLSSTHPSNRRLSSNKTVLEKYKIKSDHNPEDLTGAYKIFDIPEDKKKDLKYIYKRYNKLREFFIERHKRIPGSFIALILQDSIIEYDKAYQTIIAHLGTLK